MSALTDIDSAAITSPTPRHLLAVLYPGWGLVADGGNYRGVCNFIVHRDHRWVAGTLHTAMDDADDTDDWARMSTGDRTTAIYDTLTTLIRATGTAENLLAAIIAAAEAPEDPDRAEPRTSADQPDCATLGAAVLDLLDPDTRAAHLTLLALDPTDSMSFAATLLYAHRRITDHTALPLYRHYTPGVDTPVTTETAAETPTATFHTRYRDNSEFGAHSADNGHWTAWSTGQPVYPATATAFLNRARETNTHTNVQFQLRDPDGHVIDQA